jgi:predicted transcriptional regulator
MKEILRRDKLKIYGDLLSAIEAESASEKIVITKIQVKMNVPFDRLKKYISEIKSLDFIEGENSLRLTVKGKQYLKEYESVSEFMKRMGLTYK